MNFRFVRSSLILIRPFQLYGCLSRLIELYVYVVAYVVSFSSPVTLLSEAFFFPRAYFDRNRIEAHEFRTTWTFAAYTWMERWSLAVYTSGFEQAFWRIVSGQSRNTAVRLEGVR